MRVFLTGGAGDLGQALVPRLLCNGDGPVIFDIRPPGHLPPGAVFIQGSILDREALQRALQGCDCIVHIAAWHGIHEDSGAKNAYDFFDLNVRGTFEVFAAAAALGINKIVCIFRQPVSTGPALLYGRTKILAERIAADYAQYEAMHVISLRPRGFIPYWNRDVYSRYSDSASMVLAGRCAYQ